MESPIAMSAISLIELQFMHLQLYRYSIILSLTDPIKLQFNFELQFCCAILSCNVTAT